MKIIGDININLLPKDKDRAIISLLIHNTAKQQINIYETLKLRLIIEYGDKLNDEIVKTELEKLDKEFTDLQYNLIADLINTFGASEEEAKAAKLDLNASLIKAVEIFSDRLIDLSKRFAKNDEQQPDKFGWILKIIFNNNLNADALERTS